MMTLKGKNVASTAGTKRSRKGTTSRSSSQAATNFPPTKFGKKTFMNYGVERYDCQQEAKYMGDEYVLEGRLLVQFSRIHAQVRVLGLHSFGQPIAIAFVDFRPCSASLWIKSCAFFGGSVEYFLSGANCDHFDFQAMIQGPPYRDIQYILCWVNYVARWDRVRDTGRHSTLRYAHLKLEARVWLKIVSRTLFPCKHMFEFTRERVMLVYRLMKGLPVNAGAILRQNMLKFWTNWRWSFCYGSLQTRYLRILETEEEVYEVYPSCASHLVCHLVDVTKTKAHDPSQGKVCSTTDRQARDDWVECIGLPSFNCGLVVIW
ncbi:hypothetical protein H5410_002869 [Solanum commersonii]|uniref:Putative plant transposon protein domain-containing protein n=1 Tax=Solanum commersonii TaxID=4109 RepID=A0A9J6B3E5_SOLCO|nr:hypothetical protein H5410_002869 [Solanum commersonii]